MDEHIFQIEFDSEWQEFRDVKLWTLEIDDLFKANLENLKDLYQKYAVRQPPRLFEEDEDGESPKVPVRKALMSMQDALDFMMVESGLNLTLKEAVQCYGMSKMTVIKENG